MNKVPCDILKALRPAKRIPKYTQSKNLVFAPLIYSEQPNRDE